MWPSLLLPTLIPYKDGNKQITAINPFVCVWERAKKETETNQALKGWTRTQAQRKDSYCLKKHWRVDRCVSLYIVAHCVSGLFSGFVGYENCWRNRGRCRMGFHPAFSASLPRWRLKTALAPGITQVSLRNTEDGPVETYIGCAINPLWALFFRQCLCDTERWAAALGSLTYACLPEK